MMRTHEPGPGEPGLDDGSSPRMMVVDDDGQFRSMLREWLMEEGVQEVVEAPDGPEAIELAKADPPDVILMDLRMPKLNGIEAARQIKAQLPAVQVIMLSAYGDAALRQAAEEAGVYSYVVKGGPPQTLWHTIRYAWTYKVRLDEQTALGRGPAA
jgi:CheY-like chemotaxis protein